MSEWDRFEAWWAKEGLTSEDSDIPMISWKMVAWSAWKVRSELYVESAGWTAERQAIAKELRDIAKSGAMIHLLGWDDIQRTCDYAAELLCPISPRGST